MTSKLEIERRWLVKLPLTHEALEVLNNDPDVPAKITQTYLTSNDETVKRVRFVEYDVWGTTFPAHYTATSKRFIEHGVNEEDEHSLNETEYQARLLERDPERITIEKTRYHLHYKGHMYELDVFEGDWQGLAILELEMSSHFEWFELPHYLVLDREITFEDGWSNYQLSGRYSEPQASWFGTVEEPVKLGWFDRLMRWFRPDESQVWRDNGSEMMDDQQS